MRPEGYASVRWTMRGTRNGTATIATLRPIAGPPSQPIQSFASHVTPSRAVTNAIDLRGRTMDVAAAAARSPKPAPSPTTAATADAAPYVVGGDERGTTASAVNAPNAAQANGRASRAPPAGAAMAAVATQRLSHGERTGRTWPATVRSPPATRGSHDDRCRCHPYRRSQWLTEGRHDEHVEQASGNLHRVRRMPDRLWRRRRHPRRRAAPRRR